MSKGALSAATDGASAAALDAGMVHERDQWILYERQMKAKWAREKEEERQRRIEMGLPPEEEKPNLVKRVWRKIVGGKDESEAAKTTTDQGVVR